MQSNVHRVFLPMVPRRRLELPRPCGHRYLKPARLPIPPPGHRDADCPQPASKVNEQLGPINLTSIRARNPPKEAGITTEAQRHREESHSVWGSLRPAYGGPRKSQGLAAEVRTRSLCVSVVNTSLNSRRVPGAIERRSPPSETRITTEAQRHREESHLMWGSFRPAYGGPRKRQGLAAEVRTRSLCVSVPLWSTLP
jgi:hypothetical protein